MAKNPPVSKEELSQMISLEVGVSSAAIAEGVFNRLFKENESRMDGKVSKIIYGGIIATIFLFISLIISVWIFMGSYQQNYLDTQSSLGKEYADVRLELKSLQSQQDYMERFLLEKTKISVN